MPMRPPFSDPKAEAIFMTDHDRDEGRQYMQEEIEYYEEILRYYKRRKNGTTFTCRLPSEILAIIFHEVRYHSWYFNLRGWRKIGGIRAVSHVCSHWRDVALRTANLWTDIPFDYPEWGTEMMHRAKSAPLTIEFNVRHPQIRSSAPTPGSRLREMLANNMARINDLSLNSLCPKKKYPVALLNQPAPILESLRLVMASAASYTVPTRILQTSRLQYLILENIGMDWNLKSFDLRYLRVLNMRKLPVNSAPTVTQLLAILATTPHLSELTIHYSDQGQSLPLIKDHPPFRSQPITLRYLQKISITCDPFSCAFLMDHISISRNPGGAHKFIVKLPDPEDPVGGPLERLVRRLDQSIDGAILRLELGSPDVRGWKSKHETLPCSDSEPTIVLRFLNQKSLSPVIGWSICHSFDMSRLLALKVTLSIDEETWSIIRNLPKLKKLAVVQHESHFHKALLRGKKRRNNQFVPCPFPALQHLTLIDWNMETNVFDDSVAIMLALATSLERRKKAGLSLPKIRIAHCENVYESEIERLREVVDLDWDGEGAVVYEECHDNLNEPSGSDSDDSDYVPP